MSNYSYQELFNYALDMFSKETGFPFASDKIVYRGFTANNAKNVYDAFMSEYGFLTEEHTQEKLLNTLAEAFVYGKDGIIDVSGVLFREDIELEDHEIVHTMLHELSHIFCTKYEIEGGHFFDRFCSGVPLTQEDRINDGYMNAGYAVWREFAAELTARIVEHTPNYSITDVKDVLALYTEEVYPGNPDGKKAMSDILLLIALSTEFVKGEWKDIIAHLEDIEFPFTRTTKLLFSHMLQDPFYQIEPEFIFEFGNTYLVELSRKTVSL